MSNWRFARDKVWLSFLPLHLFAVRMIPEGLFFIVSDWFVRCSLSSTCLEKGRIGTRLFDHAHNRCELYAAGHNLNSPPVRSHANLSVNNGESLEPEQTAMQLRDRHRPSPDRCGHETSARAGAGDGVDRVARAQVCQVQHGAVLIGDCS